MLFHRFTMIHIGGCATYLLQERWTSTGCHSYIAFCWEFCYNPPYVWYVLLQSCCILSLKCCISSSCDRTWPQAGFVMLQLQGTFWSSVVAVSTFHKGYGRYGPRIRRMGDVSSHYHALPCTTMRYHALSELIWAVETSCDISWCLVTGLVMSCLVIFQRLVMFQGCSSSRKTLWMWTAGIMMPALHSTWQQPKAGLGKLWRMANFALDSTLDSINYI